MNKKDVIGLLNRVGNFCCEENHYDLGTHIQQIGEWVEGLPDDVVSMISEDRLRAGEIQEANIFGIKMTLSFEGNLFRVTCHGKSEPFGKVYYDLESARKHFRRWT